jgi:hypothetical protein
MKIFHFGGHDVARTDIINANITFDYADLRLYVDIEVQGGAIMSLDQEDSIIFMENFLHEVRQKHSIA